MNPEDREETEEEETEGEVRVRVTCGTGKASRHGFFTLHTWIGGCHRTRSVSVSAGQPGRQVAGWRDVVLGKLVLVQGVVGGEFLE